MPTTGRRTARGPHSARPRIALIAIVMGILALGGLVGMHTIHRDSALAAPSAMAAAMTQPAGHHAGDTARHESAPERDGPVRACGNCAASTPFLADGCAQAVWLFMPFLLPPRRSRLRLLEADADEVESSSIPPALPRMPSLDVLCISRT